MDERTSAGHTPFFDPTTVEAAVFDIGGVFLYPHYDTVVPVMERIGAPVPADTSAFVQAHHAGVEQLTALVLAGTSPDETRRDFWATYDHAYASSLGIPEANWSEFRDGVIRVSWGWAHEANIAAFHELAATGLPLAIVSNNDGTAAEQMKNYGVCWVNEAHELPRVAAIIDSGLVGVAKPDPMIMAPALHALGGPPPESVVYVGDTVHADIVGATQAGMQSVQLDPFDHHASYDHARLPDLAALVTALA